MHDVRLQQAVRCLWAGGVIAYPTEAVWGLGCDPWQEAAVCRLLQIKGRPREKGMILVAADMGQIAPLLQSLTPGQFAKLRLNWPGPVTWLLPDPGQWVPDWVRGEHRSVAVRVSAHPLVQRLCSAFGGPLISTSANLAGRQPARSRLQLQVQLGGELDAIVPGALGGRLQPSAIRDLISGQQLR
jgi:L-threonylcarbamoyladenylate synthase